MKMLTLGLMSLLMASQAMAFTANLPWASEEAGRVIGEDPIMSTSAPTLTLGLATSKDGYLDGRILRMAYDDAQLFVATEGEVRGAALSAALDMIRSYDAALQASDLQLAEEIIIWNKTK